MSAIELIAPATTAAGPVYFTVKQADVPVTLTSTRSASNTYSVTVSFTPDFDEGGARDIEAASQDGSAVTLTETNNVVMVRSPGRYAVTKGTTTDSVGVFLFQGNQV